jgi:hypothetical protein
MKPLIEQSEKRISDYCCLECGSEYVKQITFFNLTFHKGQCCVCNKTKGVTHIRVFNWLHKSLPVHTIEYGSK